MTGARPLGPLVHSFFIDHLVVVKGLRAASVRSYSDTIRLLLCFVADQQRTKITKLNVEDLSFEQVLGFLRYLENDRHNHVRTRNQRLAALHTLFEYIASRDALPGTRRGGGAATSPAPYWPTRTARPHIDSVPL